MSIQTPSPDAEAGQAGRAPLTGGCMCGAVAFEVTAALLGALVCHCKRCQRRTGTAWSASALTQPGSFAVTRGVGAVATWQPDDDGGSKSFCARCGSQLYTTHPDSPELIAVRMGALDRDPGVRPGVRQFVDDAPAWAPVPDDGLPRFPARMTWK
jgi:hypothetical protein